MIASLRPAKGLPLQIAIYSRVSTAHQDDQGQYDELVALCQRSGWTIAKVYREKISGTKSADARPELKQLLIEAKQRKFEKVIVWSADRLARSMRHLVNVLGELNDCQVQIFSYKQGIDTSTPMGSTLWQFLGIFAEFENGIRRERQATGIAKARERGVKLGRPSSMTASKRQRILELRQQGLGINKIAKLLGVGSGSVTKTVGKE